MKDSLRKSPTKQNKNKWIARDRETELTHLFKNKSLDISLHREFLYTSHAGFIFTWGISLTHPVLASILSGEFLLHIPCLLHVSLGSFSYTYHAGFFSFFFWGVSLTHPVLASLFCGEFLLYVPCWLFLFYLRNFSSKSHAGFIFMWGVSMTHPMLASLLSGKFLFICIWGVSVTDPKLASFLSGEFLLNIPCLVYFSLGVSLTHPMLASSFFHLGSFFYTSHAGFIFISGISLTHPMLALFFCAEFLLHIPCWILLFLIWGVSLPHPMLASFLPGEFLLHIPC